jgi:hypothetical protein
MKKYILILATLALAAVSCNKNENPVFNDADAFVAFDKGAVSVSELAGTVKIPVTLVSLAGKETTISYEAVDGTAKAGTNFTLADGAATLTFTKDEPTQIITVNILDPEVVYDADGTRTGGKYTGDLKFTLKFKSTGDVNAGRESSCTITIEDVDHPLSAILGDWTFNARKGNSYSAATAVSWANVLRKDETDDHKVWFYNIAYLSAGWAGWDISYYGVVSEDLTTITIPLGQESEYHYSNGNPVTLYTMDSAFEYIYDSGNIYATIQYDAAGHATGMTFDFDQTDAGTNAGIICYIPSAGTVGSVYGPMTATKD